MRYFSNTAKIKANAVGFRNPARRQKNGSRRSALMWACGGLFTGSIGCLIGIEWPHIGAAAVARDTPQFAVCGMIRKTCVVDGDTIWLDSVKIRIADIDTPEISSPKCDAEYNLGIRARDRLVVLLNEGGFSLETIGTRDTDQYGRKLRVIVRGGRSLGDQLVAEGLARTWTGRREPWC